MKKKKIILFILLGITTLIIVIAAVSWSSPRLLTGNFNDVREVTIRCMEEKKTKVLLPSEAEVLFQELRNASVSVDRHPDHYTGGIAQLDRRYAIRVHYNNGNMDEIYTNGNSLNQTRIFRLLKQSWLTKYTGFVSSVKIESILSLIEECFQSEYLVLDPRYTEPKADVALKYGIDRNTFPRIEGSASTHRIVQLMYPVLSNDYSNFPQTASQTVPSVSGQ
jgi:hypothetical protein